MAAAPATASAAGGFLLGVSNPKAYVAFVSLMAMPPIAAGGAADATAKWAVIVAVILAVDFAWLWLGGVIGAARMSPPAERALNLAMAAALASVVLLEIL